MKSSRIDIASIRKEQIVEAAVAVIAEQGLHNLSLSEIETKAGMKRGQLTYYFKHKEDILLAVFDHVLQLMYQRLGTSPGAPEHGTARSAWRIIGHLFEAILTKPAVSPEFNCLQYTFLSQIGYREDFRRRLAMLYEEWRTKMSEDLAVQLAQRPGGRKVSPRAMASLIQGMLHGIAMQLAADADAFDGPEMLDLCLDVLGTYLGLTDDRAKPEAKTSTRAIPADGATLAIKG